MIFLRYQLYIKPKFSEEKEKFASQLLLKHVHFFIDILTKYNSIDQDVEHVLLIILMLVIFYIVN